jgi:5-methylcytosine-specific restriction endonuclease McrA
MNNWSQHTKHCKLVVTSDKERIASLEKQLAAKDALLHEQREDLRMFEKLLAERFTELQDEVKQLRKRKKATRINRSEPERRKIAERQNWKCASDTCNLTGNLEAYDLDHIVPLWKGGEDTEDNLQALCPACHREKTDMERVERMQS